MGSAPPRGDPRQMGPGPQQPAPARHPAALLAFESPSVLRQTLEPAPPSTRIEELQALAGGLLTALEAVIAGLDAVAVANPELAKPLSGPLEVARLSLRQGARMAARAAEAGEAPG